MEQVKKTGNWVETTLSRKLGNVIMLTSVNEVEFITLFIASVVDATYNDYFRISSYSVFFFLKQLLIVLFLQLLQMK